MAEIIINKETGMALPGHKLRYPGTNFFEENQQNIFFGREQESVKLIHAIKAHNVFVIFANSGIGKTSLLNACLIPGLKKENFVPIRFRFQNTGITPLQEIRTKLEEFMKTPPAPGKNLWHHYKSCNFKGGIPLFIFDQFEEFFNHPKPDRDSCIAEVSDLVNDYLPPDIAKEMRARFRKADPTEEDLNYFTPVNLRLLVLIRSDRLNYLDELSKDIPSILRNRFHLKPLTVTQAEQAILKPASLPQNGFFTPPLNLDEVYKQMSRYLKNDEDEVESFQLQILCQELEKRVIAEYKTILNKRNENLITPEQFINETREALKITTGELGGDDGMSDIVQNYYTNRISSIEDKDLRKKAVLLLEDQLVINQRRISLPETFLNDKGYSSELLDYLVNNTRLIRVDRIKNQRYFEISHDRLLPPILASAEKRREEAEHEKKIIELEAERRAQEEQNAKLLREMKEEHQRYAILSKMAMRLRWHLRVMIILAAGLFFVLIWGNNVRVKAKLASVEYWINEENYKKADSVLNYDRSMNGMRSVFYLFHKKKYAHYRDEIARKKNQKQQFDSLSAEADTLLADGGGSLDQAYFLLKAAEKTGFKPKDERKQISARLDLLMPQVKEAFNRYIDKAQAFNNSDEITRVKKEGHEDAVNAMNVATRLHAVRIDYNPRTVDTTDFNYSIFSNLKKKLGL